MKVNRVYSPDIYRKIMLAEQDIIWSNIILKRLACL